MAVVAEVVLVPRHSLLVAVCPGWLQRLQTCWYLQFWRAHPRAELNSWHTGACPVVAVSAPDSTGFFPVTSWHTFDGWLVPPHKTHHSCLP